VCSSDLLFLPQLPRDLAQSGIVLAFLVVGTFARFLMIL